MNTREKWLLTLAVLVSGVFSNLANSQTQTNCYAECMFGTELVICESPEFAYCDCSFGFPVAECRPVY